jgi:hypothetical protein
MALVSTLESLLPQDLSLLLFIISLVLIPWATHQFSTFSFYRTAQSSALGKRPPTIPYWVPGIFHGFSVITQGPPAFFASLTKQYCDHAPFIAKIGPLSILVVRDANHVKKVFQSVKQMTPKDLHVRVYGKVMGSPKAALDILNAIGTGNKESEQVEYAHLTVPRLFFSGTSLVPMADIYIATLRRNMDNKMFQSKSWTEIEDLWSFFQIEIARATMETIFGSKLLKSYPKVVSDFWEFDKNIENFTRGLPRFMMPAAFNARDRLQENLKNWLQAEHQGGNLAKVGSEGPDWDPNKGSKFFQTRDGIFANIPSLDYQARAAEAMALMQGSTSNTMPSTFWYIFETLRKPHLYKYLTNETAPHYDSGTGKYDISTLTAHPIIQSMHAEVGRLRMATGTMRTNGVDNFKLDENWTVPKGTSVMIFSHDLGLNTELWANARPQTIDKPLDQFWPERFIIPDKNTNTIPSKDEIRKGRFSMEGVGGLHVPFGGGQHLCPGRYFAKAVQAGTLAVLLNEYEIQLSDPEDAETTIPPVREAAYGTVRPLNKVRIRIRKRGTPKNE